MVDGERAGCTEKCGDKTGHNTDISGTGAPTTAESPFHEMQIPHNIYEASIHFITTSSPLDAERTPNDDAPRTLNNTSEISLKKSLCQTETSTYTQGSNFSSKEAVLMRPAPSTPQKAPQKKDSFWENVGCRRSGQISTYAQGVQLLRMGATYIGPLFLQPITW